MSLTENDITAKNFKKFYEALSPYLGSYDKGKLTFVGEVKAFFAETAPNGFLICDGATYNKADYPQLANLLLSLTDHSAYEVSGDDTKFKVPDLRGEFLRGSGTNSHTNQGSGGAVGEHQDGTLVAQDKEISTLQNLNLSNVNADSAISGVSGFTGSGSASTNRVAMTTRPTNTSVLYCIAYKDTMVDLDFLSYGGERFAKSDMYDTNERVIGKWIDGKPLYKRTFELPSAISVGDNAVTRVTSIDGSNIDRAFGCIGLSQSSDFSSPLLVTCESSDTDIGVKSLGGTLSIKYIVLSYTKTTDTADSFKYSTPTDYSTEEKIVGTWIDGKPLYKKTLVKTNISISANTTTKVIIDNGADGAELVTAFGARDQSETIPTAAQYYSMYPVIENNNFCLNVYRNGSAFTISNVTITYIYIKTTD